MGRIIKRLAFLLGPLIAFILYLAFYKQGGLNEVPYWAPWVVSAYFLMALIVSTVVSRRRSGATYRDPKNALALQRRARTVWKVMLSVYIYAFVAGAFMLVILRKSIPLRYGFLALAINLLFILLFCRNLFWNASSKNS